MNMLAVLLAALALVPQPRKVVEFGGFTSSTAKTFRVDASLPKEGYRLKVTDAGAEIAYADGAGRLYAQVTLDQMKRRDGKFAKAEVEDWPLYPWRAWLLDVARHWLPKEHIFDVIDVMVLHKMNVLLSDVAPIVEAVGEPNLKVAPVLSVEEAVSPGKLVQSARQIAESGADLVYLALPKYGRSGHVDTCFGTLAGSTLPEKDVKEALRVIKKSGATVVFAPLYENVDEEYADLALWNEVCAGAAE